MGVDTQAVAVKLRATVGYMIEEAVRLTLPDSAGWVIPKNSIKPPPIFHTHSHCRCAYANAGRAFLFLLGALLELLTSSAIAMYHRSGTEHIEAYGFGHIYNHLAKVHLFCESRRCCVSHAALPATPSCFWITATPAVIVLSTRLLREPQS